MDRFAGRVAVVTGASSGIGAQIAKDLVGAGLVVVGVARRKERLVELAASLKGAKGRLEVVQADLSSSEEVVRVYKWVEDNLGAVSVVVNNAAMSPNTPVHDLDTETLNTVVSTNLTSVIVSCKEAINSMRKHDIKDGHIININSVAGHASIKMPGDVASVTVYTATKYGITALSKSLRFDVQKLPGFKIRVSSISPGAVMTEMLPDNFVKTLPDLSAVLNVKNVSDAVLFAISCPPSVEITELTIQPTGESF